jgi:carboxyl-terminal processing protease
VRALKRRAVFALPLVIALGAVAAIVLSTAGARAAGRQDESLQEFTRVFAAVEENFADPAAPGKAIYNGAIPGMLRALDPHSKFFDRKSAGEMQENQSGRYYGVGMSVGMRDGRITVLTPFGGTPAHRAGVRPGDIILRVDNADASRLSPGDISQLLRGARGTKVRLTLEREGVAEPIPVELVRDEIPRPTVPLAFFVKPGIAYVQITSFGQTTAKELEDRLRKLGEKDVNGLVLDLRGNPGGLLTEAIAVSSHFLNRGQLVVSHRGRESPNRNYQAMRDGAGKAYPMVILVDSGSASASEIVAGALQDHDRAWIAGQPTYGKGLVQSSFPLSDETLLWLTTAQYYTPSGRLIQRDYSTKSLLDYFSQPRAEQRNLNDVRMTDSGRTVYGGGGITPDERFEVPSLNAFQTQVKDRAYAFFTFAARYFAGRDTKLPSNWEPGDALLREFHGFLRQRNVAFTDAEFNDNREWVRHELQREMFITAFSLEDSQRIAAAHDPLVIRAVGSLPRATALLQSSRKILAERRNGGRLPLAR